MGGWTEIGHKIQSLSKLCQNPVQCLSNRRKSTKYVQSSTGSVQWLSKVCIVPVRFLRLLDRVWTWKSRFCPDIVRQKLPQEEDACSLQI